MKNYDYIMNDKKITYTIGEMAKQADGSVFVTYGKTNFLVTVTKKKLKEKLGFFPLIINFEEKLYSMGKIPGGFGKREGRPTDKATLSARLIDRPIRPLFPKGYDHEVQIVITVLGYHEDYEVDMMAISTVALACTMAGLPIEALVAGVTVVKVKEELIINPTFEQRKDASCELKASGTLDALNMIEFKGTEQTEAEVLDMLDIAHLSIKESINNIKEILADQKIEILKYKTEEVVDKLIKEEIELYSEKIYLILKNNKNKKIRNELINELTVEIQTKYEDDIQIYIDDIIKKHFINLIIEENYRLDGRKTDEIRKLSSRVDILQQAHGSSLFTRGETQSLAVTTLGTKTSEQILDGLEDEEQKSFFLHYNFPPYSVGEVGRMGAPGRREIGHGALAEKAVQAMMPSFEEFPYTVRVVSEILESNGSSSQASICAATMSLLNAGVPLKKHVAGIAMGLVYKDGKYKILTDIAGLEDHLGDMDFKVAGTKDGITAIQMDIKVSGINRKLFEECLTQAKVGRLELVQHLADTIPKVGTLKDTAPKIEQFKIEVSKIRDVIGKNGVSINKIIEETNVKIDIDEFGGVIIYGSEMDKVSQAADIIKSIAKTYKIGEKFGAEVVRLEKFGAFVKFDGNADALLHISDVSKERVEKIEDALSLNQKILIEIKEIDLKGRMKVKKMENND